SAVVAPVSPHQRPTDGLPVQVPASRMTGLAIRSVERDSATFSTQKPVGTALGGSRFIAMAPTDQGACRGLGSAGAPTASSYPQNLYEKLRDNRRNPSARALFCACRRGVSGRHFSDRGRRRATGGPSCVPASSIRKGVSAGYVEGDPEDKRTE